jgi:hypothetical protein
MTTRTEVYAAIDGERTYQDSRWDSLHIHSFEEWFVYIEDYVNEAKHILARTATPGNTATPAHIMRKVAAMAVCAMEQNGAPHRELENKGNRDFKISFGSAKSVAV